MNALKVLYQKFDLVIQLLFSHVVLSCLIEVYR